MQPRLTVREIVRFVAKREIVHLVDDLDGKTADETVRFGLDGATYEIDLSDDHAAAFRDHLSSFVAVARRTDLEASPRRRRQGSIDKGGPRPRSVARAMRAWARDNGFVLSDRGRIPAEVVEAYHDAGDAAAATATTPERDSTTPARSSVQQAITGDSTAVAAQPTDADVLAWHEAKNYKIPANRVVNGLMWHRYRTAHAPSR